MDALTVLLVEDDKAACDAFAAYIDTLEDIRLVGITDNADEAVKAVQDMLPHAIILDLELQQGGGDGLSVLDDIRDAHLPVNPFVLVTTNCSSQVVQDYAHTHGCFIKYKHQNNYSEKEAVDFLRRLRKDILSKWSAAPGETPTIESPRQREQRILQRIHTEFNLIGISPKMKGREYLIRAVQLVIAGKRKNISGIIARENSVTQDSVERAMQNAINKAWNKTDIEDLLAHYTARVQSEKGVPSILEFTYHYANKIKDEY